MSEKKMRIWFVTRSYPPTRGGGPFVRKQQVDYLREQGYPVTVVTLPQAGTIFDPSVVIIDPSFSIRVARYLERLHLISDYLQFWSKQVCRYLVDKAAHGEVIFVTTGGELGFFNEVRNIKKIRPDLKVILNYHDVLDYASYEGEKIYNHPHLNIEKNEAQAIESADIIIAQSQVMQEQLRFKYSVHSDKIDYCYFGFDHVDAIAPKVHRDITKPITIGYIGAMGPLQSPEILIEAYKGLPEDLKGRIELVYIGDSSMNKMISQSEEIERISFMPRDHLVELLAKRIEVAFVSAINIKPLRALMSTKFYEYIGLGLPVLCALPQDCEAGRVVNKYKMGWVADFDRVADLTDILVDLASNPQKIDEAYREMSSSRLEFDSGITLMRMTEAIQRLSAK